MDPLQQDLKVYEPNENRSPLRVGSGGMLPNRGFGHTAYEDDDDDIYGPVPDYDTIKSLQ